MPRRALFMHIQKTAGTTIQNTARQAYGNDQVCSHADYLNLGLEGCARLDFVSGHFCYDFARALMADRYSFTFLRCPKERLVSLYRFCHAQPAGKLYLYDAAHQTDLDGFLRLADDPRFERFLRNTMVWQLTQGWGNNLLGGPQKLYSDFDEAGLLEDARRNIETFDYVGLAETADTDIPRIFSSLGVTDMRVERHNASPTPTTLDALPMSTLNLLNDLTRLDQEIYDHALRLRQRRQKISWFTRLLRRR